MLDRNQEAGHPTYLWSGVLAEGWAPNPLYLQTFVHGGIAGCYTTREHLRQLGFVDRQEHEQALSRIAELEAKLNPSAKPAKKVRSKCPL